MVNNRKVRLMTQLAMYEKHEGKRDIRIGHYYKSDFARLNVLKTAITVTIGYILILLGIAFYNIEYLFDNALTIDYASMGKIALAIYIGMMTVYLVATLLGYSLYYQYSRRKLGRYFRMLRRLKEIYDEEDGYSSRTEKEDQNEGDATEGDED